MPMKYLRGLVLALSFAVTAVSAQTAKKPKPPPTLCIGDDCVTTPEPKPGIKWNPGHYIGTYVRNSLPSTQVTEVKAMKAVAPEIQGIGLWYEWRFLEPYRGDYSGIKSLVAAVDTIHAAGLKAYVFVVDDTFGGTRRYAPDYLTSEPNGAPGIYTKANGGTTPVIWVPAIMNRVIALFNELGSALDSHPAVEVIHYRELDPNFGSDEYSAAKYSDRAYLEQLKRWAVAIKAAFPQTNIAAPANFMGSEGAMSEWVEFCYRNGVGIGGPDVLPQAPYTYGGTTSKSPTWTDRVLRGQKWDGSKWVSGGIDYRGKIFIANQVQDPEMGRSYVWPPRALYEYAAAKDGLAQTHLYWWRKDYAFEGGVADSAETYWSNKTLQPDPAKRIKDFLLQGGHQMQTAPPAFYNGEIRQ